MAMNIYIYFRLEPIADNGETCATLTRQARPKYALDWRQSGMVYWKKRAFQECPYQHYHSTIQTTIATTNNTNKQYEVKNGKRQRPKSNKMFLEFEREQNETSARAGNGKRSEKLSSH